MWCRRWVHGLCNHALPPPCTSTDPPRMSCSPSTAASGDGPGGEPVVEVPTALRAGGRRSGGASAAPGAVQRAPSDGVRVPDAGELAVFEGVAVLLGHRDPMGRASDERGGVVRGAPQ